MKDKLHIEDLFREQLGTSEIKPSAGVWKAVSRKLRWKQFIRFDPGKFNLYYLAGLAVVGAGIIAITSQNDVVQDAEPGLLNTDPEIIASPQIEKESAASGSSLQPANSEQSASQVTEPMESTKDSRSMVSTSDIDPEKRIAEEQEELSRTESRNQEPMNEEEARTMVTYFTTSESEGCAPLTVRFYNHSVHSVSSNWSFGTGEQSTGNDPVYTFKDPGSYTVTLSTQDDQGQTGFYRQVIRVLAAPSAEFEIEEGLEGPEGLEQLDLVNYSTGAFAYAWKVVGKQAPARSWMSNEFQPHIPVQELEQGMSHLQLIATSENGCVDTLIRVLPSYTTSVTHNLQFPNAFSPNTSGPGGGHYNPNDRLRDVFHPVFKHAPPEYRLRIYTRRGELVFETENIYIGWDGYFQQERALGGVYVWMAEGSWQNGQEFRMQGDVTLIWTDQR